MVMSFLCLWKETHKKNENEESKNISLKLYDNSSDLIKLFNTKNEVMKNIFDLMK